MRRTPAAPKVVTSEIVQANAPPAWRAETGIVAMLTPKLHHTRARAYSTIWNLVRRISELLPAATVTASSYSPGTRLPIGS